MKKLMLELSRFASVGLLATLVGVGGMFAFYNLLHLGYWSSSALAFVAGAALSFVLNRRFTFRHGGSWKRALLRFAMNVAICYGLAFGAAKPLFAKHAVNALRVAGQQFQHGFEARQKRGVFRLGMHTRLRAE